MSSTRATILKNAFSLFGAQLITWSVTLLVTVIVPRYLGPTLSGQLIIGYAIWAVVVLMTEFGMDTAIIKEVARTPDITPNVLGTTLLLRLIFFVIGCGLVAIYTSVIGYSAEVIEIIFLIGIAQLFLLLGGACRSVLEGIESMQSIALVDIITKAIHMVLAIAAVLLGYGLRTFVLVAIIVALAYLITMLLAVLRRFPLMFQTNMASAVGLLQQSVPYLFSKAAIGLYAIIDIWLISHLLDAQAVGWYGAAGKLFATSLFIPTIFMTVLFPALARLHTTDPEKLLQLIRRGFDMLLLVSVPVGLGLFIVGQPVIDLLYGPKYTPAGPILSIMGIAAIFTYLNALFGRYMFAIDRQRSWVGVMVGAALLKIPLGLLFIPWFQDLSGNGALGAAFGNIITEGFMTIIGISLMPKGTFTSENIATNAKIIVSGILMAAVVWLFYDLFVLVPIMVGVIVYTALVLVLRIVPEEDLKLIGQFRHSLLRKFRRNAPHTV